VFWLPDKFQAGPILGGGGRHFSMGFGHHRSAYNPLPITLRVTRLRDSAATAARYTCALTYARIPARGRAGRFRVTRPAARRRLSRETPTEPLCLSVELEGVNSPFKLDAGYYAAPRGFSPGGACAVQDTFAPGYVTHPRPYCNYPPASGS